MVKHGRLEGSSLGPFWRIRTAGQEDRYPDGALYARHGDTAGANPRRDAPKGQLGLLTRPRLRSRVCRSILSRLTSLLVVLGLAHAPALGRTWVASPDGTTGDGSLVDILPIYADGDSIRCLSGEHQWDQGEAPLERSVTIYGDAKESVTLSGEWFSFINCDSLVVKELALRRFGTKGGGISRVRSVSFKDVEIAESRRFSVSIGDRATFSDCVIRDNTSTAEGVSTGIAFANMEQVSVQDCVFSGNQSAVGSPDDECACGGVSLAIHRSTNTTVTRCIFVGNRGNSGCAMYQHPEAGDLLFEHNVIVGNTDQTAAVVVNGSGASQIIRNNIFADNVGYGLWCGEWTIYTFRVYCNAFWQNQGFGYPGSQDQNNWYGLITARGLEGDTDFYSRVVDPLFCPGDSYGLSEESPLLTPMEPCTVVPGTGNDCIVDPVIRESWGGLKSRFGK